MIGGRLRHRVTIQEETDTEDEQGGYTSAWSTLCKLWAQIEPLTASEQFYRGGLQAGVTHRVTLRYRDDIGPTNRVVFNSRTFNIRGVRNIDERNTDLELLCEEVVS